MMTHITPELLSGYLDDALPAEEKRKAELHLASCGECRAELAQVRRLQRRGFHLPRPVLMSLAAAAALLLVVVIPRETPDPSTLRSGTPGDAVLGIVSPLPSEPVVTPGTFVWRSAGAAASYTFVLQREDGTVAWRSSTPDTSIALPDSLELGAGRTWFWFVDALLLDGQSLSTGVQRMRTTP